VAEAGTCACHVHVGVPSRDLGVQVLARPVRLHGLIDAIDRATGEKANIYDTTNEPGGVLRIPCSNRRETSARPARRCTRATPGRSSGPG